MEQKIDSVQVPASTDLPGWQKALQNQQYHKFRDEDIVAAIQDLGPTTDKAVLNTLAKHLSDRMMHSIRRLVGTNHPNRGVDIIEEVHFRLWEALLKKGSDDGRSLRVAFSARVRFRVLDALKRAKASRLLPMHSAVNETEESDGLHNIEDVYSPPEKELEVAEVLEKIIDPRKRLAFRLYMDRVPFTSKLEDSIEKALGITERTAREWIKETQETLKKYMEMRHDNKR